MIDEKELDILKKSIKMLDDFYENVEYVNSSQEFVIIHNRNIETIKKIAIERNSEYIKSKILSYPRINKEEIDDYIKSNRKEINIVLVIFGYIYGIIIDIILRMIKTKGSTSGIIKSKLFKIKNTNMEILKVIENPYLEKMYSK